MVVLFILVLLTSVVGYGWPVLGCLGYHGVFVLVLFFLLLSSYWGYWELYGCWLGDSSYSIDVYTLLELGNGVVVDVAFYGNWLSAIIICIMVMGLLLVLFFVYVEMWDDKEGVIFALLLTLFLIFMGVLVISSNLIIFYVGWEGIGIISLFLINFWSERVRGIKAVLKVFFINKVGDFLLLIGIVLLIGSIGILDFCILDVCSIICLDFVWLFGGFTISFLDVLLIIFVIGGGVKSSQYGFHIWLLEAMEAPLGASALMHSSTLVVAGIILVYKLYPILLYSNMSLYVLVVWGSWTALFAAWFACWQYELKVILAYSTISSMGFIYLLLGFGALYEASIYLVIHAFLKIFLFLTIGLIMFFAGGMQDVRWTGGLLYYIPYIWGLYFGGAVGLSGLPYWSGYACKSYLWLSLEFGWGTSLIINNSVLLSTIFTYVYLFRVGLLVFWGSRGGHRVIYRYTWGSWLVAALILYLCLFSIYCVMWWCGFVDTSVFSLRWSVLWWSGFVFGLLSGNMYIGWLLFLAVYIFYFIILGYTLLVSTACGYNGLIRIYWFFNCGQILLICWTVVYAVFRMSKYIYSSIFICKYDW